MNPADRKLAKETYRKYMLAHDVHLHNLNDEDAYEDWINAYGKWVRAIREYNIGRFHRKSIHEEVLAELATVL